MVEFRHLTHWVLGCGDYTRRQDAVVLCRLMGYEGGLFSDDYIYTETGESTWGDEYLGDFVKSTNCQGNETDINDCDIEWLEGDNCNDYLGLMCNVSGK